MISSCSCRSNTRMAGTRRSFFPLLVLRSGSTSLSQSSLSSIDTTTREMSGSHDSRKGSCFIPRSCFWCICHCILRKMHIRPRVLRPNKIILSLPFLESTSTIATTVLLTSITRTSRLRRVRLETDLDAQLLPLRRLVTRTLCIKRIEHVVDVDH